MPESMWEIARAIAALAVAGAVFLGSVFAANWLRPTLSAPQQIIVHVSGG